MSTATEKPLPPPANDPAAPESKEDCRRRKRREGMRALREREKRGEGLALLLYNWRQVNRMVARGQIPDCIASDPGRLKDEIGRIASDLMRREFGD